MAAAFLVCGLFFLRPVLSLSWSLLPALPAAPVSLHPPSTTLPAPPPALTINQSIHPAIHPSTTTSSHPSQHFLSTHPRRSPLDFLARNCLFSEPRPPSSTNAWFYFFSALNLFLIQFFPHFPPLSSCVPSVTRHCSRTLGDRIPPTLSVPLIPSLEPDRSIAIMVN